MHRLEQQRLVPAGPQDDRTGRDAVRVPVRSVSRGAEGDQRSGVREVVRGFTRRQAADHEDPGRRPVAHRSGGHVAAAPGRIEDGDEWPAHATPRAPALDDLVQFVRQVRGAVGAGGAAEVEETRIRIEQPGGGGVHAE